jgi:regulator of chromosome condensation
MVGFTKEATMKGDKLQRKPILIPQLNNIKTLAAGGNHIQALDHKAASSYGALEANFN